MTDYAAIEAVMGPETNGRDPLEVSGVTALSPGCDLADVAGVLQRLRPLLPADALARRVLRNRVIGALKSARIQDAAGLVDAALPPTALSPGDVQGQGTTVTLKDPEPWPEPVDGPGVLDDLARTCARFTALGEGAEVVLALWIVHAHAHDAAQVSPILAITSPEKECGKTTLLTLLLALTPRALLASNISTAGVFRTVEKYRPTLLVDEADTFLRENDELRGILNSGHFRAGALIVRNVGDDFEPRTFSTWCAKAIALIGELPDTLTSRSIAVPMRRCTSLEAAKLDGLRLDRLGLLEPLRRQAWRWSVDHRDALRAADPVLPAGVRGRTADNWRALLAIADVAGGAWPDRARAALTVRSEAVDANQAPGVQLLVDLRALFHERGVDRLPSADVVSVLVQQEDRPWPEWKGGRPLTVRQLARLLARFGVQPKQMWLNGGKVRGYEIADFGEVWSRYLPPESVESVEPNTDATKSHSEGRYDSPGLPHPETAENARGDWTLPILPHGEGDSGQAGADESDEMAREVMREGEP